MPKLSTALSDSGIAVLSLSVAMPESSGVLLEPYAAIFGGKVAGRGSRNGGAAARFVGRDGRIQVFAAFYGLASRISARISRTASESPVRTARAMMLWPMLNSVISGMAATSEMLR